MADLTYNDIQEAILEALTIHDLQTARSNSGENKLRKEANQISSKILDRIKEGFDERKSADKEFLKKLESSVGQKGGNDFEKEKLGKVDNFLTKVGSKVSSIFSKLADSIGVGFLATWNSLANNATQEVANSLRSMNTTGLSQDWDQFIHGLKDSTIQLNDLVNGMKNHSQAVSQLTRNTGNAAGTVQKLARNASEYATNEAHVVYDSKQLTEGIFSYMEAAKASGNMDRLNEAQMQAGVNRLISSTDQLAKEYGLNRDELMKSAAKTDTDVGIAMMGRGMSADQIAEVNTKLATIKETMGDEAYEMARKMIATGGLDAESIAAINQTGSQTMFSSIADMQSGDFAKALDKWMSDKAHEEMGQNIKNQGAFAGTLNMFGPSSTSLAQKMTYKSSQVKKNENTKTDETLVKQQKMENERIRKENNMTALMARSAENAAHMFDTVTASLKAFNSVLSSMVGMKEAMSGGWFSKILGWGGAGLSLLGGLAGFRTIADSFRTIRRVGRAGSAGKLGSGLKKAGSWIGNAGKKAWGGIKKAGSWAKNGISSITKGGAKSAGKTVAKSAGKTAAKAAGKGLLKGGFKSLLKKIPGVSAVAGTVFAAQRALAGDWAGAAMEMASGIAGTIPGIGTAVSTALDVGLMAKDAVSASKESANASKESVKKTKDVQTTKKPTDKKPSMVGKFGKTAGKVALGAGIIGGVGYGAYKLYDYFAGKKEDKKDELEDKDKKTNKEINEEISNNPSKSFNEMKDQDKKEEQNITLANLETQVTMTNAILNNILTQIGELKISNI